MILAIKTSSPVTELYLVDPNGKVVSKDIWESGRELSVQLHQHINDLLKGKAVAFSDLAGIVVFEGPGSFTGLRIGVSVANAMAFALNIPVAAAGGDDWIKSASQKLGDTTPGNQVLPEYGKEANVTEPKR